MINLPFQVDGLVLSGGNFGALNAGQQKQFIQTASAAISHAMLDEALVQECTCAYADPFSAFSTCINKDRKPHVSYQDELLSVI